MKKDVIQCMVDYFECTSTEAAQISYACVLDLHFQGKGPRPEVLGGRACAKIASNHELLCWKYLAFERRPWAWLPHRVRKLFGR